MNAYVEVENPKVLARLNRELAGNLRAALPNVESRDIGWPAGRFHAPRVHFQSPDGSGVFWWAESKRDAGATAVSLFGHDTPGDSAPLNIEVQFNLPIKTFNRRYGGAFLEDGSTGTVVLAHRGIATLGHGRVPRQALIQEMSCTLREASTTSGKREFVVIGELSSPSLANDLIEFAAELRRSARVLQSRGNQKGVRQVKRTKTLGQLRDYFDEYSGKRDARRISKTDVADCYHGTVVRALRDVMNATGKALKSREIDLVLLASKKTYLIEVKTSASSQSIYTAVGQLLVHAPSVANIGRLSVEKVLVLPELPPDCLSERLTDELGIQLLTFTRSPTGRVSISGLEALR